MTYFLVLTAGIALGYLIRSVDLRAREYRGEWADVFADVPEPPSNVKLDD